MADPIDDDAPVGLLDKSSVNQRRRIA